MDIQLRDRNIFMKNICIHVLEMEFLQVCNNECKSELKFLVELSL